LHELCFIKEEEKTPKNVSKKIVWKNGRRSRSVCSARYTQFKDMRHNGGVGSPSTATQLIHPCADDESDGDEPLLSGSGAVNTVTSDEVMAQWQTIVNRCDE
jgi:hypothetical protein